MNRILKFPVSRGIFPPKSIHFSNSQVPSGQALDRGLRRHLLHPSDTATATARNKDHPKKNGDFTLEKWWSIWIWPIFNMKNGDPMVNQCSFFQPELAFDRQNVWFYGDWMGYHGILVGWDWKIGEIYCCRLPCLITAGYMGHKRAWKLLPSGERLHSNEKSPFLMGKSTINGHFQLLC